MEFENLITLIKTVSDSELTGFKYEEKGVKIQLSKRPNEVKVISGNTSLQETPSLQACASGAGGLGTTGTTVIPEILVKDNQNKVGEIETCTNGKTVESPLVGTFYTAPSEDSDPFVAVGDTVRKGQTLAIVEAMKLMNEIESDYDGMITEILAENGQAVEYGQPLFRIS